MGHKQVEVRRDDETVLVDEGMAEILPLLWSCGIRTVNSCQENQEGRAWIQFLTAEDASNFLNLGTKYPKKFRKFWNTSYGRATQCGSIDDWEYSILPENWGVEDEDVDNEVIHHYLGYNDFKFFVSIRFPVRDIAKIVRIVKWRKKSMICQSCGKFKHECDSDKQKD